MPEEQIIIYVDQDEYEPTAEEIERAQALLGAPIPIDSSSDEGGL